MENKVQPILTILIPTRNRAKNLDNTIRRIVKSIDYCNINFDDVEIIISDNFSKDNTKQVAKSWEKKKYNIIYYKQKYESNTAEESLVNSLSFCHGEYIWVCCDDDFVKKDALNIIFKSINIKKYDFILFSFDRLHGRKIYNNFEFYGDIIEYSNGIDLFRDFGFITLTSLIPCLCFKNGTIDSIFFRKCINQSSIYSHSFSLLKSYYNRPCALVNNNILTYNVPNQTGYIRNIAKVSKSIFLNSSWSIGLIKLINITSKEIDVEVNEIAFFTELQPIMETENIKYTILWAFILRSCLAELLNFYEWKFLKIYKNKQLIINYHDICIDFFKKLSNSNENVINKFLEILIESNNYFKNINENFFNNIDFMKKSLSSIHDLSINYENLFFSSKNFLNKEDAVLLATNNNPTKFLSTNKVVFFDTNYYITTDNRIILSLIISHDSSNEHLLKFLKYIQSCNARILDRIEVICCIDKHNKRGLLIFNYFKNKIKNLTLISIDKFQINNKFDYLFEINCLGYYVWNIQKDYYLKLNHIDFIISSLRSLEYPLIIFPTNKIIHVNNDCNLELYSNFNTTLNNKNNSDVNDIRCYVKKNGFISCSEESIYIIKKELFSQFKDTEYQASSKYILISLLLDKLIGKKIKCYNILASFKIIKDTEFKIDNNINPKYKNNLLKSIRYFIEKKSYINAKQKIDNISFDTNCFIMWKICFLCLISIKDFKNSREIEMFKLQFNFLNKKSKFFIDAYLDYLKFYHLFSSDYVNNEAIEFYKSRFRYHMKNIIKKGVINNYNNGKLLIIRLKIEKFFLKLKKLLFIFSNRMTEITKRKITNKKLLLKQIKYNIKINHIEKLFFENI